MRERNFGRPEQEVPIEGKKGLRERLKDFFSGSKASGKAPDASNVANQSPEEVSLLPASEAKEVSQDQKQLEELRQKLEEKKVLVGTIERHLQWKHPVVTTNPDIFEYAKLWLKIQNRKVCEIHLGSNFSSQEAFKQLNLDQITSSDQQAIIEGEALVRFSKQIEREKPSLAITVEDGLEPNNAANNFAATIRDYYQNRGSVVVFSATAQNFNKGKIVELVIGGSFYE